MAGLPVPSYTHKVSYMHCSVPESGEVTVLSSQWSP